jgi:hypothetical protein
MCYHRRCTRQERGVGEARDGHVVKGRNPKVLAVALSAWAASWLTITAIVIGPVRTEGGLLEPAFQVPALLWGAGVLLAGAALAAIRRAMRFGASHLVLDTTPLRLGGWASGVVEGPTAVHGSAVEVDIHCLRRPGGRSPPRVLWRTTKVLDGSGFDPRATHASIPFAFRLPPDAAFVGADVTWHLGVQARIPGLDYRESFEVPVAAADPASPFVDARPPRAMPELTGPRLMEHLPSRLEYRADADVFRFPLAASRVLWPLGLGAIAIGVPLLRHTLLLAGWPAGVLTWTPIVCGVLAAVAMVTLLLDPRRVEIRANTIRIRRGVLGVGLHRTVPVRDVAAVLDVTSNDLPPAYVVRIRLRNGETHDVAATLREPAESRALALRLRQILEVGEE